MAASPPIGAVRGLVSDAEGNLWIRLDGPHLLRYRDGRFEDAAARYGLEEAAFTAMALDGDGHPLPASKQPPPPSAAPEAHNFR